MNNIFQERRSTFLLLVALLFVLCAILYIIIQRPLAEELVSTETSVEVLEDDITILNAAIATHGADDKSVDIEEILREREIPLTRELEELLLSFEAIELISTSRIEKIALEYDSDLPESNFELEESEDPEEPAVTDEAGEADETEAEDSPIELNEENPIIDFNEQPDNLRAITVQMDVLSPDYEHFQEFIKAIEKQERIMIVSQLGFKKPAERELFYEEESDETMIYSIEVTTFYYEG